MADTKAGGTTLAAGRTVKFGASTLIASPRISIPMPSGAKPLPQKPAGQAPKPGKSSS
jgi:hypothetical protein